MSRGAGKARKKMMRTPSTSASVTGYPVDPLISGIAVFLLIYGLVMVASASMEIGARTYGDTFHLLARHGVWMLLGGMAALVAISLPISVWQRCSTALLGISFLLLLLVLVPGVGKEVNGATRWIALGPFNLQGAEFVKLFIMIYMAGYLVHRKEAMETSLVGFVKPLLILALVAFLLLGQPDFGTAIVIVSATLVMIFLAGAPWKFFLPLVALSIAAVALIATLQPYRLARLIAFADPWQHQFGSGYQLTQALIAFGRGEWAGTGLGNSIQKLFFLPEAHTDFLLSIIAEELGMVGVALVIVLFTGLVIRGLMIGIAAGHRKLAFHAHLAYGLALILGIQASVNMGVNLGLLPTKGLTLPLMSYGGNSLIVSCVMIAILLRVEFETRQTPVPGQRGGRRNG